MNIVKIIIGIGVMGGIGYGVFILVGKDSNSNLTTVFESGAQSADMNFEIFKKCPAGFEGTLFNMDNYAKEVKEMTGFEYQGGLEIQCNLNQDEDVFGGPRTSLTSANFISGNSVSQKKESFKTGMYEITRREVNNSGSTEAEIGSDYGNISAEYSLYNLSDLKTRPIKNGEVLYYTNNMKIGSMGATSPDGLEFDFSDGIEEYDHIYGFIAVICDNNKSLGVSFGSTEHPESVRIEDVASQLDNMFDCNKTTMLEPVDYEG
jgi:hypothetical protein